MAEQCDYSRLSMEGFELVDTPGTPMQSFISLDEFNAASPLNWVYCRPMTEDQFQDQGSTETEKALQGLMDHLEENPSAFVKVLRRRKQEELENSGMVSFLKHRFLSKLHGQTYRDGLVTQSEGIERLEEVKSGIIKAFNYSEEAKTGGRRYSKRLEAKRSKAALNSENTPPVNNMSSVMPRPPLHASPQKVPGGVPPPPPPCPPPPMTPLPPRALTALKDKNIMSSTPIPGKVSKKVERRGSTCSMASIHEELLLQSNPLKRLRSTRQTRSPGGTPDRRRPKKLRLSNDSLNWTNPLNQSEPLAQAFMRIMEQKFRNVRTPSPAISPANISRASMGDFTP